MLLGAQHSPKAAATPTRQVSWGALVAPPGVWCCTRAKESQAPAARGTLPSELRALMWAGAAGLQKTLAAPRSHQRHCFVLLQADIARARLWHSRWSHTHVGGRNSHSLCPTHVGVVQICSLLPFHPPAPFHITRHIHHPRCCQSITWAKTTVLGSRTHRAGVRSQTPLTPQPDAPSPRGCSPPSQHCSPPPTPRQSLSPRAFAVLSGTIRQICY